MKILAFDLAEKCGWAIAQNLPEPAVVTCDLPGSDMRSEVRTWVQILDSGLLLLGDGAHTPQEEGIWLDDVRRQLIDFLQAHSADVLVYEFSPWLRGSGRTSTRGMLTTVGLRFALLMATAECKVKRVIEIDPNAWQHKMIGGGNRELRKSKSRQMAAMRLGLKTDDHNISDAALMADYIFACLRTGTPGQGEAI